MSDMKLIMENWRTYTKANSAPTALLSGDRNRIFNDPIDQLLYEHAMGKKKLEDVALVLENYIDAQYKSIIEEGILDDIRKGAGKVKDAAKTQLYKFVYGTAGMAIRLINSVMNGVISPIRKLVDNIKTRAAEYIKSKEEQSKIIQVLVAVAKKVKQVIAPLKTAMEKIGKLVYGKGTRHPAFKGCLLAVSCAAALLALTCGGLFAGVLAFAPAYAGKKLAFAAVARGAKAGLGAVKGAMANKAAAATALAEQIINEVASEVQEIAEVSAEVWAVAKAFVAQAIQLDPDPESVSFIRNTIADVAIDGDETIVRATEIIDLDQDLDDAFGVLNIMRMEQFSPENITAEDYAMLSDEVKQVMGVAVKMATEHCKSDPTACAGKDILLQDIDRVLIDGAVGNETVNYLSSVVKDGVENLTRIAMSDTSGESIKYFSDAAKEAAKQIKLDPNKVKELAQEMGLAPDREKVIGKVLELGVQTDKDPVALAQLGKDLGMDISKKQLRQGVTDLTQIFRGLDIPEDNINDLVSSIAKAAIKDTAGAKVGAVVNERVVKPVSMRAILAEVNSI